MSASPPLTPSPTSARPESDPDEEIVVDLRDRNLAALLAWLIPGAGHLYQRRWGKGIVFAVCILGTFFYGLFLGKCRVVYAQWGPTENQRRLPYLLQIGVGLPAMPALVQAKIDPPPLGPEFMAPPKFPVNKERGFEAHGHRYPDELAMLNLEIDNFELGTVFTMIAGLLNVLAIYDAWGGPVFIATDDRRKKKPDRKSGDDRNKAGPDDPPTGDPSSGDPSASDASLKSAIDHAAIAQAGVDAAGKGEATS